MCTIIILRVLTKLAITTVSYKLGSLLVPITYSSPGVGESE